MIRVCKIFSEDRYVLPNLLLIADFPLITCSLQTLTNQIQYFVDCFVHNKFTVHVISIETNRYMYFHWFPIIDIIKFLCTTFENFTLLQNDPKLMSKIKKVSQSSALI